MHAAGMGGLLSMVVLIKMAFGYQLAIIEWFGGYQLSVPIDVILYMTIICTGMVCTSRLILKAHQAKEVYLGLVVGIVSITAAYLIL